MHFKTRVYARGFNSWFHQFISSNLEHTNLSQKWNQPFSFCATAEPVDLAWRNSTEEQSVKRRLSEWRSHNIDNLYLLQHCGLDFSALLCELFSITVKCDMRGEIHQVLTMKETYHAQIKTLPEVLLSVLQSMAGIHPFTICHVQLFLLVVFEIV